MGKLSGQRGGGWGLGREVDCVLPSPTPHVGNLEGDTVNNSLPEKSAIFFWEPTKPALNLTYFLPIGYLSVCFNFIQLLTPLKYRRRKSKVSFLMPLPVFCSSRSWPSLVESLQCKVILSLWQWQKGKSLTKDWVSLKLLLTFSSLCDVTWGHRVTESLMG